MKANFYIDRNDQAYPAIRQYPGESLADNHTTFATLGEAKKELLRELVSMKLHYQGLINDVRYLTTKQVSDAERLDY